MVNSTANLCRDGGVYVNVTEKRRAVRSAGPRLRVDTAGDDPADGGTNVERAGYSVRFGTEGAVPR